jgi:hypothetical protein
MTVPPRAGEETKMILAAVALFLLVSGLVMVIQDMHHLR